MPSFSYMLDAGKRSERVKKRLESNRQQAPIASCRQFQPPAQTASRLANPAANIN